jgi:hypothetical protein
MDKKPKTIFQLDSSFTSAQWYVYSITHILKSNLRRPEISANDQDTILELLCKYVFSYLAHVAHFESSISNCLTGLPVSSKAITPVLNDPTAAPGKNRLTLLFAVLTCGLKSNSKL